MLIYENGIKERKEELWEIEVLFSEIHKGVFIILAASAVQLTELLKPANREKNNVVLMLRHLRLVLSLK